MSYIARLLSRSAFKHEGAKPPPRTVTVTGAALLSLVSGILERAASSYCASKECWCVEKKTGGGHGGGGCVRLRAGDFAGREGDWVSG